MNFSLNLSCRIFHQVIYHVEKYLGLLFWLEKNGTFTLFFAQPLGEFFARIRSSLLWRKRRTERKHSYSFSKAQQKSLYEITRFFPTCITNSKNPFFVLVFCIGPDTQGYDDLTTTKCSCSFDL